MTDPTTSELVWRVEQVAKQLVELAGHMRQDREHAAKLYVTRENHTLAREKDQAATLENAKDIEELKTENKRNLDWRRTATLAGAIATVGWLLMTALAVSNYLAR